MYSEWFGPIVVDVEALVDKQWTALMGVTITGKQYNQKGQPDSGLWGVAKGLRDEIKQALKGVG